MTTVEELTLALSKLVSKKPKPKIPIFSGRLAKAKETQYDDWSYMVNKIRKNQKDYDISDQVFDNLIFQSLVGEARSRYIRLEKAGKSLTDVLSQFEEAYGDKTAVYDRMRQLHEIRQHRNESVLEYADRLEKVQHWVGECPEAASFCASDEMLKVSFIKGLWDSKLPDLLYFMMDDRSKSYRDVCTKAVILEKERSHPLDKKPVKAVQEDYVSQLEKRISILENMQRSKKKSVKCFHCAKEGHVKKDCYKFKRESLEKGNAGGR